MKRWLVAVAFVLIAAGCRMPEESPRLNDNTMTTFGNITRHTDTEAGVVCWVFQDSHKGGISCLPLADTKLGDKK